MTTPLSNHSSYVATTLQMKIGVLICLLISSSSGFNWCGTNRQHRLLGSYVVSKHPSCELCLSRSSCNEARERHDLMNSQLWRRGGERQSRLFYVKRPYTVSSKLLMTTTGSSNNVSNDSQNPFVRVWCWFRKLLAKLWVSANLEFMLPLNLLILISNFALLLLDIRAY